MAGTCVPPLGSIPGTGFNTVVVPDAFNSAYKSINEKLLYEIWQTLLLILAANPPAVTQVISFAVGDGQAGSPVDGDTFIQQPALQGIPIFNKQLLVVRNLGVLDYNSPVAIFDIRRYNSGGLGGFTFEGGQIFSDGDQYNIYIIGINNTVEV